MPQGPTITQASSCNETPRMATPSRQTWRPPSPKPSTSETPILRRKRIAGFPSTTPGKAQPSSRNRTSQICHRRCEASTCHQAPGSRPSQTKRIQNTRSKRRPLNLIQSKRKCSRRSASTTRASVALSTTVTRQTLQISKKLCNSLQHRTNRTPCQVKT